MHFQGGYENEVCCPEAWFAVKLNVFECTIEKMLMNF